MGTEYVGAREWYVTYLAGIEVGGVVLRENFPLRHFGGMKLVSRKNGGRSSVQRERRVFGEDMGEEV